MIRLAENKETVRFENQALGFVGEMVRWSNRLEEATTPASKAHCLKKRAKYRNKAIVAFERAKKAAKPKS